MREYLILPGDWRVGGDYCYYCIEVMLTDINNNIDITIIIITTIKTTTTNKKNKNNNNISLTCLPPPAS